MPSTLVSRVFSILAVSWGASAADTAGMDFNESAVVITTAFRVV
jgi:hypothetical protein